MNSVEELLHHNKQYFELIIRLPGDVDNHLPGISDHFVQWLTTTIPDLPDDHDWDVAKVNQPLVVLAGAITHTISSKWRSFQQQTLKTFYQLEEGTEYFHLHCLLEMGSIKSFVLGRYIRQIAQTLTTNLFENRTPNLENWFSITKSRRGGQNKIQDHHYLLAYLIPKLQPECQWAWTNIPLLQKATLNASERARLHNLYLCNISEKENHTPTPDSLTKAPIISNRTARKYCEVVDWLVAQGITTEKQWLIEDKDSYRSFQSTANSSRQVRAALDNARAEMLLTKSAPDYLLGPSTSTDMDTNRIYQIFLKNGYDPLLCANILVRWASRDFNKRNTIWLYGPATTGKTNIAEAIAHAVPFYGCVNWTNENFPFNDCVDKMIIWWEEGKMTNKVVEAAKAILGGSKVRVDQKCKGSVQIEPTPVIITSNTDMTVVADGNSITMEHKEPLEERMFKFQLNIKLPIDFGKITKQEVRNFFRWGADNKVNIVPQFNVPQNINNATPPDSSLPCAQPGPSTSTTPTKRKALEPLATRCEEHADCNNLSVLCCSACTSGKPKSPKFSNKYFRENFHCMIHGTFNCLECYPLSSDDTDIDDDVFAEQ
uniref:Replication protein n=1 Tax=Dependoparvovirus sp. TaxID=2052559 RepID=A0A6M9Z7I6_9VIRU|nr:MAG: replication protein [Dependoparvovirus sp.]